MYCKFTEWFNLQRLWFCWLGKIKISDTFMMISAKRRRKPWQMAINFRNQSRRRRACPWWANKGPRRTQTFRARGGNREVCRSMADWIRSIFKRKLFGKVSKQNVNSMPLEQGTTLLLCFFLQTLFLCYLLIFIFRFCLLKLPPITLKIPKW